MVLDLDSVIGYQLLVITVLQVNLMLLPLQKLYTLVGVTSCAYKEIGLGFFGQERGWAGLIGEHVWNDIIDTVYVNFSMLWF